MTSKKFRLWLNARGVPLYVEVLSGELTFEGLKNIHQQIEQAKKADKPLVLSPEWELRALA